jgi:hypothetical protein
VTITTYDHGLPGILREAWTGQTAENPPVNAVRSLLRDEDAVFNPKHPDAYVAGRGHVLIDAIVCAST